MEGYIPRILLCGDIDSFRQTANMDVEIVGQISFTGATERGENYIFPNPEYLAAYVPGEIRIFLDGAEISADDLRKILNGTADYIVFDSTELIGRQNELYYLNIAEQAIPCETLFRQARRQFYSYINFLTLKKILREEKFSTLLDVDAAFAETDLFLFDVGGAYRLTPSGKILSRFMKIFTARFTPRPPIAASNFMTRC